jgi:C-terminal peptidase prc
MSGKRPLGLALSALACVGLSCGASPREGPISSPSLAPSPTSVASPWPATNEFGVRFCQYNPAAPAAAPELRPIASTPTPIPTPTVPAGSAVDPATTARQLDVLHGLWNAVNEHYVDPGFNGRDWAEIGDRYQAIVDGGLADQAFYGLMQAMLGELGDGHSYFQSPAAVEEEARIVAEGVDFVGIGMLAKNADDGSAVVILVFPDGPAAEAGLQPHDTILSVDGGPVRDEAGVSRTRGPEGTTVGLTVRSPGEAPREMTVTRRRVTGALPVDSCVVPGTRLAYVMLPTFLDETVDDQLKDSLGALTAEGPLEGLIIDMRMNGGGSGSVAQAALRMFLGGPQGAFVTRTTREEYVIEPEDVGGSQAVPLVVLVGPDTVSYGEVVSGILQLSGRAAIIGQPTLGNVEQLRRYDFEDGSRAWLASATFEPVGLSAGIWEDTGIHPDVIVPGEWSEFTEANDPGLAAAIETLLTR